MLHKASQLSYCSCWMSTAATALVFSPHSHSSLPQALSHSSSWRMPFPRRRPAPPLPATALTNPSSHHLGSERSYICTDMHSYECTHAHPTPMSTFERLNRHIKLGMRYLS